MPLLSARRSCRKVGRKTGSSSGRRGSVFAFGLVFDLAAMTRETMRGTRLKSMRKAVRVDENGTSKR
jgi:hypothetical protein